MRKTDKSNGSDALAVVQGDGVSTMPEAFAGMYQTGYNDGYTSGQESGFRKGFEEGYAAAHKGPNGAAVMTAAEIAPAPKRGPRRMLLGLPCTKCGVYFASDESHCPGCRLPQKRTPAQPE
jgi:hypothetical protein